MRFLSRLTGLIAATVAVLVLAPGVAAAVTTPYTTSQLSCGGAYWDTYQGVLGLHEEATCTMAGGDLAYFGNSRLDMQPDGNLVIYAIDSGRAAWSSVTQNEGATSLVFQTDANMVIYNAAHAALWWTNHTNYSCPLPNYDPTLTFQIDGNMVIYCRNLYTNVSTALWSSNTWIH